MLKIQKLEKIGIIGCDETAAKWAILYASGWYDVVIYGERQKQVDETLQQIKQQLTTYRDCKLAKINERIKGTVIFSEAVKNAILLQECLSDDIIHRQEIFQMVDKMNIMAKFISLTPDFAKTEFVKNMKCRHLVAITRPANLSYFVPLIEILKEPNYCRANFLNNFKNLLKALGRERIVYIEDEYTRQVDRLREIDEPFSDSESDDLNDLQEEDVLPEPVNEYEKKVQSLNLDQKKIFDEISNKIDEVANNHNAKQVLHFIHGSIGTGKTYLSKLLVEHIKRAYAPNCDPVAVAAYTGPAAAQIHGTTLRCHFHSLPSDNEFVEPESEYDTIERDQATWYHRKWLIIDGISMVSYEMLGWIDSQLQLFKNSYNLFGGINVLLFGDLMQLSPLPSSSHWCYHSRYYADKNNIWRKFSFSELFTNMRQRHDPKFVELLNNLRFGNLTLSQLEMLCARRRIYLNNEFVYRYWRLQRNIGAFSNKRQVDAYNNVCTRQFCRVYTIHAVDKRLDDHIDRNKANDNEITDKVALLSKIQLAVGSRVMLRTDVSIENGLVHGAMGYVKEFRWLRCMQKADGELPLSVSVKFDDETIGHNKDAHGCVAIRPIKCLYQVHDYVYTEREMIPLVLCWAMNVYDLQGVTVDEAVIDLGKNFTPGHAYVALGCVKNLDNLAIARPLNVESIIHYSRESEREINRLRHKNRV